MKGKHLTKEMREMIWSYYNLGKSAEECHEKLFLGSEITCKLKNIKKLYRLFADPSKENELIKYLATTNIRGPKVRENHEQWYDDLVSVINFNDPTTSNFGLRLQLEEIIENSNLRLPSLTSVGRALQRCKLKRKRCTFLSNAQDPVQVFDHMERMAEIEVDHIVNFDETSARSEKFMPIYGHFKIIACIYEGTRSFIRTNSLS